MQTIQYVQPQHHAKLGQAELLVVDEAAAIPLPLVKKLMGPYLVFLCSTVNGYGYRSLCMRRPWESGALQTLIHMCSVYRAPLPHVFLMPSFSDNTRHTTHDR